MFQEVRRLKNKPVGESPTDDKRLKPCSRGGAMAENQDGEDLGIGKKN